MDDFCDSYNRKRLRLDIFTSILYSILLILIIYTILIIHIKFELNQEIFNIFKDYILSSFINFIKKTIKSTIIFIDSIVQTGTN
jgi:hypothetical protein